MDYLPSKIANEHCINIALNHFHKNVRTDKAHTCKDWVMRRDQTGLGLARKAREDGEEKYMGT